MASAAAAADPEPPPEAGAASAAVLAAATAPWSFSRNTVPETAERRVTTDSVRRALGTTKDLSTQRPGGSAQRCAPAPDPSTPGSASQDITGGPAKRPPRSM